MGHLSVWHDRLPEPYFRTGIKEKSDFTAVNGSKYGWADSNFQTSDSTYNIYTFKYIYPNVGILIMNSRLWQEGKTNSS